MLIRPSLIEGLKNKNEKAYMELFDTCFIPLHELAYSYILDSDIANDIVQDTFISIYIGSTKLESVSNLGGYLRNSIRNRCLNYLRDLALEDKNRQLYLQELIERKSLDDSELEDLLCSVYKIMETLPDNYREVCYLRFREGLKIKEIAERLSISDNAVKVQIHRAIMKMKEILGNQLTSLMPFFLILSNFAICL